jgi:leader peptidase (prepilin peptidase) / N-methyltransferase
MSPLGALVGAVVGIGVAPFSSVLAERPPLRDQANESLRGAFRCSSCRNHISWSESIPVLTWLIRRRCRHCGDRIPVTEVINDVLCIVVGALTGLFVGLTSALPALLVLALVLVPMTLIDLRLRKIPTRLVYPPAAVVAVLLAGAALVDGDPKRLLRALGGGLIASALMWLLVIVYPAGMGDGDARLCLLLGLGLGWFGWIHLAYGLMAGFVIGSVVGIGYALTSGQGRKTQLPFGPWLGAGALLVIFAAPRFVM